jgi:acetyltransferase-like isoleucine patch superfamily enzyme
MDRTKRLQRFPTRKGNALQDWYKTRNPLRLFINFVVVYAMRFAPSLRVKNFFYRLLGARVGRGASIALGALFDVFFPDLIEVGENATVGYNTVILAHEFLQKEWRKGPVKIGKNALVGANCVILPGVVIGDNAVVSSMSLVNKDVPANAFYGGVPARKLRK